MKILLWHGYLLSGSGSNLYTANLARVWRKQGHDVVLLCQERAVDATGFVDAQGDFDEANERFEFDDTGIPAARGSCRIVRPNIGDLLPVYVYDEYEGFTVKTFVDLSDEELQHYTETNVRALVAAIAAFRPDAIITGHEVMGPFIAWRACAETATTYLAKLHGSALEYAVKKQDRYLAYARDGLGGAKVVTGGSNYMIAEAASVIPGWRDRATVVNPGCDVDIFVPRPKNNDVPVVGYVGKFIPAKGVHNFLAALGRSSRPLRAVVVGYGGFEKELHQLWDALARGDEDGVRSIAERGDGRPLPGLIEWFDRGGLDEAYREGIARVDLEWAGRLDHGPLSEVLPTFDALVVPSVVPEAFGMVAAEAAACGVLPILPAHSGIGEIGETLERELDAPGLLTFDPARPVEGIAERLEAILELDPARRQELEQGAAAVARQLWSWEHVADQLLELAAD